MRLEEERHDGATPGLRAAASGDYAERMAQNGANGFVSKQHRPARGPQAQPDAAWRGDMESICKQELEMHNIELHERIGMGSTGAVMRCTRVADGREQQVAVKVYHLGGAVPGSAAPPHDPRCTYNEVMRQYGLYHPHVVQMHAIVRTQHFLCIVMELANGGDVFRLVKSAGGLPEPAARFIFQQLALTLGYLHAAGMYIRDVKPSNLLIFWNANGMPILKITDFNLAKDTASQGPVRTPVSCTMYTAPQVLRNRGKSYEQMAAYGPVCDVWSAAVTLYYLIYAKWPFSKNQILSWASSKVNVDWEKVKFSKKTKHGRVSSQLIELLTRIFSCGNMTAAEFQQMGVTVEDLIGCPWFQQDLPTGALDMRERCLELTRARVGSADYEHVREYLLLAGQEYLAGTTSMPPGAAAAPGTWLEAPPAVKQQPAGALPVAIADWMAGFSIDALPSAGGSAGAGPSGYGRVATGWTVESRRSGENGRQGENGRHGENGRSNGRNGVNGRSTAKENGGMNGHVGSDAMANGMGGMGAGMGADDMGGDGGDGE
eukprot:jgi/Ulvmu1/685/UM010_0057.1